MRSRFGFTLLEVMVATVVVMLAMVLGFSVLEQSRSAYVRAADGDAVDADLRELFRLMAEDASSMSGRAGWRHRVSEGHWAADEVSWQFLRPAAAQSPDAWIGDCCVVRYRLSDQLVNGRVVRCLMRSVMDSGQWREREVSGVCDWPADQPEEMVAEGVVSFRVQPVVWNAESGWSPCPDGDRMAVAMRVEVVAASRPIRQRLRSAQDWDASLLLRDPERVETHPDLVLSQALLKWGGGDGR